MNIDERLGALAQSMELLQLSQQDTDKKIRGLAIIAEQNEVRAGEMMDSIKRLARIADIHENRIARLET
jgi:hypothetical protein